MIKIIHSQIKEKYDVKFPIPKAEKWEKKNWENSKISQQLKSKIHFHLHNSQDKLKVTFGS